MNPNIFREYDIRGIVGNDLNAKTVEQIGLAIGTYFRQNGATKIAIGYDARESSPEFCKILTRSLNETGCDCFLIGRVPTPVLYFTTFTKEADGGVMITGSHNPAHHNGFKISLGKESLHGSQIQAIKELVLAQNFTRGLGKTENLEVLNDYFNELFKRINFGNRNLKVVIDAGNGMGGVTAVPFYQNLGVEIIELFCNPDSNFPNHEPDPSQEKNLQYLITKVVETKADLGIAFDGDADRVTIIDETGRIIWGDELMILFAHQVLAEKPNSTIIAEVKCTNTLFDEIERLGGHAIMSKAGHSIIKAKMRETGAILGGEMSGHIFFADRFYGFDDACYAGARVLEILSKTNQSLSQIFAEFPQTFATPEIRISCPEEKKALIIEKLIAELSQTNEIVTIDGIRIKFENGWGLVRPSNTQALLILRFEANSEENLTLIRQTVESRVKALLGEKF
ncbi:MAG TPA: phosphomannomutase/phosphoglucomutase [Pyrinomonadaceae bacterium]|nr:phosphomannomutase/phosphoglucomutase [Pyrinomonadaceae bacterium]